MASFPAAKKKWDLGLDSKTTPAIAPSAEPSHLPSRLSSKSLLVPTTRQDKRLQFGMDCADMVQFTHWELGKEHVKHLIVKNVAMKTQKIKYKLPTTRFFSMEFPETVTLSAGMSWNIPITFRPVAKECYNDVIEFTTSLGKFLIPIKATLPEHLLEFPSKIDFSYCPTHETARKTFLIKNTGELDSHFEWDCPAPFSIHPQSGNIPSGASETIRIEFKPQDACMLQGTAVCVFGDETRWEKSKVLQGLHIAGIGKYSFIGITGDNQAFDFGQVFIGKSAERKFTLENFSNVQANFAIRKAEKNANPYFEFSHSSGTVAPHCKLEITITYTPTTSGMESTDYFNIETVSGNTVQVTCVGRGIGPTVTLSQDVVNFGDNAIGTTSLRSFTITNSANTTAFYQFLNEAGSTFRIDKPWGTISPNSTVTLTVRFSGYEPINYYRRHYCLVDNQDGLYIDFLGTSYNEKRRPATFNHGHVVRYLKRVENGLWMFGPEHLEELLKAGDIKAVDGALRFNRSEDAQQYLPQNPVDRPCSDYEVASEYFYENTGENLACTLVDSYVDFGACSRYRMVEPQTIRIANNTTGKMSCVWVLPGDSNRDDQVFSITPKMTDIPAKSVAEFKVHFRPQIDNSFYGLQLECFVFFKSMRSFRLVNDETFTPSWCLTPMVAGNTFSPGEDTFIPKVNFGDTRLDFPACYVDKSVYRTVRVTNTGDTPVKFSFADSQGPGARNSQVFSVKPRIGMLHSNESRLIVFRFSPSEEKVYENALKCHFNSSFSNSYDLQVRGEGHYPNISFGELDTIVFRPTCIGAVSTRTFTARNASRISVDFEWKIPRQYSSFVSIAPSAGVLRPNSKMEMTCTFAPTSTKHCVLKLPCYYKHEKGDFLEADSVDRRSTLTVLGNGSYGEIKADVDAIDFDVILVNTVTEREITLFNSSNCDVFYSLEICQSRLGGTMEHGHDAGIDGGLIEDFDVKPNNLIESELQIVQTSKMLPSRSSQTIKIKACVKDQKCYNFSIFYRLESKESGDSKFSSDMERVHLCEVSAQGVHPVVQFVDIRSEGLGKSFLWDLFSIDRVNECLHSISMEPMAYADFSLETFSLASAVEIEQQNETFTFDFGATPVGQKPTLVSMAVRNDGVVPVDWVFNFPNDLQVHLEGWADPGEYTEDQVHQNLILDNSLFSVTPKSGTLSPNQTAHVLLSYTHEFAGLHKLPVVFKLKNGSSRTGKEVKINFVGYSVIASKRVLQIPASVHYMEPIAMGVAEAPIQMQRIINRGTVPLEYSLDTSVLDQHKEENYDFEIFKCRKTKGVIPPNGVEFLEWIFRPLAAKNYEIEIPIHVKDGKSDVIKISGQGLGSCTQQLAKRDPKQYTDTIPFRQVFDILNEEATLSLDRINFGHVPLGAILRQVVLVRNSSYDSELVFKWKIPQYWGMDVVRVSPSSGLLKPGESKTCKVTFCPKFLPRIYDLELFCEMTNKALLDDYTARRDLFDKLCRETVHPASQSVSCDKTPRRSAASTATKSDLNKYRALPPISSSKLDKSLVKPGTAQTEATISEEMSAVVEPTPPESFSLILTIKARSYTVDEFRSQFNGYETFYFDKKMYTSMVQKETPVDDDMRGCIEGVMLSILDDLLLDPDVKDHSDQTNYSSLELFPYYAQLCPDPRNGIFPAKSETLNLDEPDVNPRWNTIVTEESPVSGPSRTDFLSSLEFQNFAESILESTLYNLMQEANAEEWDLTKFPMLFSKTD